MVLPFIRKLRHGARLTGDDERVLSSLAEPTRSAGPRVDIIAEGRPLPFLPLIIEGWACHYRLLENGKRQIISLFLPGDLCGPFRTLPHFKNHALATLTPMVFAPVSFDAITAAAAASREIEEVLWWDLLVASAMERERIVSLGRRTASERLGHCLCELHCRLRMVGLIDGLSYDLATTQADLGDLLGLSTVHVNRSLRELKRAGLVSLRGRRVTIDDPDGLRHFSLFEEGYLHADGSRSG